MVQLIEQGTDQKKFITYENGSFLPTWLILKIALIYRVETITNTGFQIDALLDGALGQSDRGAAVSSQQSICLKTQFRL